MMTLNFYDERIHHKEYVTGGTKEELLMNLTRLQKKGHVVGVMAESVEEAIYPPEDNLLGVWLVQVFY